MSGPAPAPSRRTPRQLVRFAIVGLASNAAGYLVYLLLTALGMPPKLAMTCLYVAGATASFLGNRRYTFEHQGDARGSAMRFALAHAAGYVINLSLLVVFVDRFGVAHQLVQGVAIFVVAAFLFVVFRYFVFAQPQAPR